MEQLRSTLLGLLVVVVVTCVCYFFLSAMIDKLNSVNSDLSKAIIAAFISVVGATVTIVAGKIYEQKIKIRQDAREKKIPIYEKQLSVILNMFLAEKLGERPPTQTELIRSFREFMESLFIWGGPEVIKAWQKFGIAAGNAGAPDAGIHAMEEFIFAVRKEIGSDNSALKKGELIGLLVHDFKVEPSSRGT